QGVDVERLVDCGWAWLTALHQTGNTRVADLAAAVPQAQGGPGRQAVVLSADKSSILLPALYVCASDQKTGSET
ncbi:MAG: hypothetical protein AAFW95_13265, partial [Cyanobacteria bacterium J06638_6]